MSSLAASAGWGVIVGASLLAGAAVASLIRLSPRSSSAAAAFGGGMLLAAVALVLGFIAGYLLS